jgi:O-antigen/teichoic acid export membrane protein
MNSSQRLVSNTLSTYFRSIISVGLTLFSSRWVLKALGQTDFGLFVLTVSIINFIVFLNRLLADSAARQYAFATGQGKPDEVNRWFNAAISAHFCLAIILVGLGWPIGQYVILHKLTIPMERVNVTLIVFHLSLVSAFTAMISVPFIAMFSAKQRISELAGWGILNVILTFILAWILQFVHGDRLLVYAAGMVLIPIIIQGIQIYRSWIIFPECKLRKERWFAINKIKELLSFASWNLFGGLGVLFRNQGSAILINIYYGPKVNAAYGIATQVSNASGFLTTAMTSAFAPEINTSAGRGDNEKVISLAQTMNKLGTIMVMVFALPIMFEMDRILKVWLVNPPPFSGILCQLLLTMWFVDRITTGYSLAVSAHGKIARYQATLGTILLLTLPIAWILIKYGLTVESIGIAFVTTMVLCSLGRAYWAQRLLGIKIGSLLTQVVFPCGLVAGIVVLFCIGFKIVHFQSFLMFVFQYAVTVLGTLVLSYFVALNQREKKFIILNGKKIKQRIPFLW